MTYILVEQAEQLVPTINSLLTKVEDDQRRIEDLRKEVELDLAELRRNIEATRNAVNSVS